MYKELLSIKKGGLLMVGLNPLDMHDADTVWDKR